MRIAVIGATGRLGQQLLTAALSQGHQIHALTRRPQKIPRGADNLTVFRGDVDAGENLATFLAGCTKIVWVADSSQPDLGVRSLLAAIGERPIERIVFVSRLGAGESRSQAHRAPSLLDRLVPWLRWGRLRRLAVAEDLLRNSKIPHVILRAAHLTDGPSRGDVVVSGPAGKPPGPVSRRDLARYILRVLDERGWKESELTIGARRR
jgi:uncharacterized protein YbjT (DUF2867 family)